MQKYNLDKIIGLLVIFFVFSVIILSPFGLVWAWNILFGSLHFIDYTFDSWVAVSIFMWAFGLLKLDFTRPQKTKGMFD